MITHHYFSYLIRIWRNDELLPDQWHASLEDPISRNTVHFKSLDELFEFLRQKSGLTQGEKQNLREANGKDGSQA